MSELFTAIPDRVSLERWRKTVESGLRVDKTLSGLIWKPESALSIEPAMNCLPGNSKNYGPLPATESELIVCDDLRGIHEGSVRDAVTDAIKGGADGIAVNSDQFCLLPVSARSNRALYVYCNGQSAWKSVLEKCEDNEQAGTVSPVNILFDPFVFSLDDRPALTSVNLSDIVRTGLKSEGITTGSIWSVDVSGKTLQSSGVSGRIGYVLASISSLFQEITRADLESPVSTGLVNIVWPVGNSFLLEVAALRSLRMLIPQILETIAAKTIAANRSHRPGVSIHVVNQAESFGAVDDATGTQGRLIACTLHAATALICGCDSLCLSLHNSNDRTIAREEKQRWIRNIPLILRHEGLLDATSDPLAGSYVVEELTDQLSRRSWKLFLDIESAGGLETENGLSVMLESHNRDAPNTSSTS